MSGAAMLELSHLTRRFQGLVAVDDVSTAVGAGELVGLIGPNGAGKTTLFNLITGFIAPSAGEVRFLGRSITGLAPHRIARLGIGLVPEGRHIFPNLTVRENLLMAQANPRGDRNPWTYDRVIDFFPRLGARAGNGGGQLSGGEQQMLAIGRALMTNPRLLVLDEATEGLAPVIRDEIWGRLKTLRGEGLAMLIIDKEIEVLAEFADRHYAIEKGEVVWCGDSHALMADAAAREKFMGV